MIILCLITIGVGKMSSELRIVYDLDYKICNICIQRILLDKSDICSLQSEA